MITKITLISISAAVTLAALQSHAQIDQGAVEASLSGTMGSVSYTSDTHSAYIIVPGESHEHLSLALRPGYYIVEGLDVEPEFLLAATDGVPPSFSISGNLAYNVMVPGSHVAGFVLAGYGTGNTIPATRNLFSRPYGGFDIGVLNLGAGLKFFLSERVALRTEYRFQKYSQEMTFSDYPSSVTLRITSTFHQLFLGFSVFFP